MVTNLFLPLDIKLSVGKVLMVRLCPKSFKGLMILNREWNVRLDIFPP
jgi:hypothetical protein